MMNQKSTDECITVRVSPAQIAAEQNAFCNRNDYPHFAPWNGRCYKCGANIYDGDKAITLDFAGANLVTGCPYCHYSFVE